MRRKRERKDCFRGALVDFQEVLSRDLKDKKLRGDVNKLENNREKAVSVANRSEPLFTPI